MFHFLSGEKKYGTLERLAANEESGDLRTNIVHGYFLIEPTVGMRFFMVSAPLNGKETDERKVATSMIVSIESWADNSFIFKTENSTYKLSVQPVC